MPSISVIVLAAGRSTRFAHGQPSKLVALLNGVPIVRRAVVAALEADVGGVVVVTGDRSADVAAALDELPIRLLHEPAFGDGMAASLSCGVRATRECDAVMIALGDQPEVRPEAYRRVATRWTTSGSPIVVPRYAASTIPSHPTLFGSSVFAELLALRGDVGARTIVARDPSRVVNEMLEWPEPEDVDTIDDLNRVASRRSAPLIQNAEDSPTIPLSRRDESQ